MGIKLDIIISVPIGTASTPLTFAFAHAMCICVYTYEYVNSAYGFWSKIEVMTNVF